MIQKKKYLQVFLFKYYVWDSFLKRNSTRNLSKMTEKTVSDDDKVLSGQSAL